MHQFRIKGQINVSSVNGLVKEPLLKVFIKVRPLFQFCNLGSNFINAGFPLIKGRTFSNRVELRNIV